MPSEQEVDQGMLLKGYSHKLIPLDGSIEPLYVKSIGHIGPLLREYYPTTKFDVKPVCCQLQKEKEGPHNAEDSRTNEH